MDYGLLENWIHEQWYTAALSNIEVAEKLSWVPNNIYFSSLKLIPLTMTTTMLYVAWPASMNEVTG